MSTPTINNSSNNSRKNTERRISDRRHVEYEFNSPLWIEHVKLYYVAWPRFERRETMRRKSERRQIIAKNLHTRGGASDYASELLTAEEKLYFDTLFSKETE